MDNLISPESLCKALRLTRGALRLWDIPQVKIGRSSFYHIETLRAAIDEFDFWYENGVYRLSEISKALKLNDNQLERLTSDKGLYDYIVPPIRLNVRPFIRYRAGQCIVQGVGNSDKKLYEKSSYVHTIELIDWMSNTVPVSAKRYEKVHESRAVSLLEIAILRYTCKRITLTDELEFKTKKLKFQAVHSIRRILSEDFIDCLKKG